MANIFHPFEHQIIEEISLVDWNSPPVYDNLSQLKKEIFVQHFTMKWHKAGHRWDTTLFSDRERRKGVKGEVKVENKPKNEDQKQKELQLNLETQYTARLRR
ncbi:arginine/serine-rich coiled-coil protein 2 [Pyrus ussuriensis x Pyrus communis]|uniref:Arginine/serine-rich coiled-coil protein 2 n=1 Tax=Pyrus ussuriensis x Pyrus communis TaxID=2448454 RepID=A0A5N5GYM4_9ROSA|nr:arginine/serine-rich coiled-coil protein 2 [Pyrus ussuriensis x Pyrus communis]